MKLLRSNSVAFSRRHLVSVLICILCAGSCGPEKDKGNVHKRATSNNQRVLAVTPHIISCPNRDLHLFIKNELDEPISTSDISFHIKDTPAYRAWVKDGWGGSGRSDLCYSICTGNAVQDKDITPDDRIGFYAFNDTEPNKIGRLKKCEKIIQPEEKFILQFASDLGFTELANVRLTFVISYKGKEVWSKEIPFPEWHIQPSE